MDTPQTTGLLCYTDGSGLNGHSGACLAVYKDEICEVIHTNSRYTGVATVFQAELCAIQMACVFALEMADMQVLILSDSQAAILATQNPLIYSQCFVECPTPKFLLLSVLSDPWDGDNRGTGTIEERILRGEAQ
jgi:hypothetical protein